MPLIQGRALLRRSSCLSKCHLRSRINNTIWKGKENRKLGFHVYRTCAPTFSPEGGAINTVWLVKLYFLTFKRKYNQSLSPVHENPAFKLNEFSCLIWSIFSLILCYKSIHWCRGVLQHVNLHNNSYIAGFYFDFFFHFCAVNSVSCCIFVLLSSDSERSGFCAAQTNVHGCSSWMPPFLSNLFPQNNLRIMLM